MTSPSQPLDPGAAIGDAFSIYRQQAGVLIPLALVIYAIPLVASLLAVDGGGVAALIVALVGVLAGFIFTGSVVQLVRDVQDGQLDASVGQLVQSVMPVLLPLVLVSIVATVIIGIGFVLIIVPGLIAMTLLAVVAPVTVIERPGVFASLGRSRALVRGSGWQVFGVILFVIALGIVASAIGAIFSAPFGDTGSAVVEWVVSALLAPVQGLLTAVVYFRLRSLHGEAPVSSDINAPGGPSQPGPFGAA